MPLVPTTVSAEHPEVEVHACNGDVMYVQVVESVPILVVHPPQPTAPAPITIEHE